METEAERLKSERMIKATMKTKQDHKDGEGSDWESAEEDYQHIKLEDLLSEMQIKDSKEESDEEVEDEDDGVPIEESKEWPRAIN